jgi:hypothetical protein
LVYHLICPSCQCAASRRALPLPPNQNDHPCIPHPVRGTLRDRHERWTRRVIRRMTRSRTAKSCGPGAPTLALSPQRRFRVLQATGARKPGPRGTIAQGMPVEPAEPVVTAACFSCCRRAMGEAITRHSLRPPRSSIDLWGEADCNTRARTRRGTASTYPKGGQPERCYFAEHRR